MNEKIIGQVVRATTNGAGETVFTEITTYAVTKIVAGVETTVNQDVSRTVSTDIYAAEIAQFNTQIANIQAKIAAKQALSAECVVPASSSK